MNFALSEDQASFRDAARDLFAKEVTLNNACAPRGTRRPANSTAACGTAWRRWACWACSCPNPTVGSVSTRRYLVPILEEAGRVALPHPLVETAMVAAPLVGDPARHGRDQPWRADHPVRL